MLNFPLMGGMAPTLDQLPKKKRDWRASLFDRLNPDADLNLADDDKAAISRQGLLGLAAGLLGTGGGFGNALSAGIQGGLLSMNQGTENLTDRRYKRQLMANQNAMPSEYRSADLIARAAGFEPGTDEYKRFMRVQGGVEGRASSAGFGFDTIKGADGRERVSRRNPRTGAVEVYDEASGDFMPLGGGAAMPAVGGAPAAIPGVYIDPTLPPYVQAEIARAEAAGQQVPDTISGNAFVRRPANPGLGVSRAPEEQAARTTMATEQAKIAAYLANAGTVSQAEAAAAAEKAGAEASARSRVEIAGKRDEAQYDKAATLRLYETAMRGAKEGLEGSVTGPIVGRLPAVTANQQIAEGGVAAMAPVLKALFRNAGEGTFTDKDQELLLRMVPTRMDLPEARAAKLANIDRIVRAKLGPAPQADAPRSPAVGGWGIRPKGN